MAALEIIHGIEEAPLEPLTNRTVAIIGYGNQGRAHALNVRDSHVKVVLGTRADSQGYQRALNDGFQPVSIEEAVQQGDLIIIALPDEVQSEVFEAHVAPHVRRGATIGFLHGYSIHHGLIQPSLDVGVVMIAPKGPGTTLRERYLQGLGIPCLYALHQDSPEGTARAIAFAWANAIGCARAAIICTTFAHETETDLFGEQAVLCGGMTSLILAAFETIVKHGYPPELAYLECCHEVKQVADLIYDRGLVGMMKAISNTAEFGAYKSGPMIVDQNVRQALESLLEQIRNGNFAETLQKDHTTGFKWFEQQRATLAKHPIEQAGKVIRSLMPLGNSPEITP